MLALGDVVGRPGCRAVFVALPSLIRKTKADFVIANGENAKDGFGITPQITRDFFKSGVDVITSGNHIWQHQEILPLMEREERILRPENYPLGVPGKGHCLLSKRGFTIGVINLQGNVNLSNIRSPFHVGEDIARKLSKKTRLLIVDFHAEVPEEKEAIGLYLDGRISALYGTHTHVATADEKILQNGTGYITDIGMTGPAASVIGMKPDVSIRRSLTQIPYKMEVEDVATVIMGLLLELDVESGRTLVIQRVKHEITALN